MLSTDPLKLPGRPRGCNWKAPEASDQSQSQSTSRFTYGEMTQKTSSAQGTPGVWSTAKDESENSYFWGIVGGARQQVDMSDPIAPATMLATAGMDQDGLDWWVPDSCVGDPFHDDWSF